MKTFQRNRDWGKLSRFVFKIPKIPVNSVVRDSLSKAKSRKKHMMLGITGCEEKEKVQLEKWKTNCFEITMPIALQTN